MEPSSLGDRFDQTSFRSADTTSTAWDEVDSSGLTGGECNVEDGCYCISLLTNVIGCSKLINDLLKQQRSLFAMKNINVHIKCK